MKRIRLRRARAKDWQAIKPIRNSAFVLAYNCMQELNDKQLEEMVSQDAQSANVWYIERLIDSSLIGAIYAGEDSLRFGVNSCEISYYLGEAYSHQGYMSEALEEVIRQLFERYDCISARAFKDNEASCRLLERLGFQLEGILTQAIRGYGNKVHDDCLYVLKK